MPFELQTSSSSLQRHSSVSTVESQVARYSDVANFVSLALNLDARSQSKGCSSKPSTAPAGARRPGCKNGLAATQDVQRRSQSRPHSRPCGTSQRGRRCADVRRQVAKAAEEMNFNGTELGWSNSERRIPPSQSRKQKLMDSVSAPILRTGTGSSAATTAASREASTVGADEFPPLPPGHEARSSQASTPAETARASVGGGGAAGDLEEHPEKGEAGQDDATSLPLALQSESSQTPPQPQFGASVAQACRNISQRRAPASSPGRSSFGTPERCRSAPGGQLRAGSKRTCALKWAADERTIQDLWCVAVRAELVEFFGSGKDAFSTMDLNGNGLVSLQEFSDCLERLPACWQRLEGVAKPSPKELFKLLDEGKTGSLRFADLFPEEAHQLAMMLAQEEVSTPRFWSTWCSQPPCEPAPDAKKGPRWRPAPEEEHQRLVENAQEIQQAEEKRKWISSTMERLKRKGKSDSRCREILARHLPRGTGPKDRHNVHSFSDAEVRQCRKQYNDWVHDHSRRIQKGISDMRNQRRILQDYRHKLWEVTMEPAVRRRQAEEELMQLGALASSLMGGGPGMLSRVKSDHDLSEAAKPNAAEKKTARRSSVQAGLGHLEADNVHTVFMTFADKAQNMRRREFSKLLGSLVPGRTLSASDVSAWWRQLLDTAVEGEDASPLSRFRLPLSVSKEAPEREDPQVAKAHVSFERFVTWWVRCELRSGGH